MTSAHASLGSLAAEGICLEGAVLGLGSGSPLSLLLFPFPEGKLDQNPNVSPYFSLIPFSASYSGLAKLGAVQNTTSSEEALLIAFSP